MKETTAPRLALGLNGPIPSFFNRSPQAFLGIMLWLVLAVTAKSAYAQGGFCGSSEVWQQILANDPGLHQTLTGNEGVISDAMHTNPLAIMNHTVYTIPVVFHVIHLGEPVGQGTNISDAKLIQGISDLNTYFRDAMNTGTDVEIEFCLAQRTPSGLPSTGINRVNGTGVGGYENPNADCEKNRRPQARRSLPVPTPVVARHARVRKTG
ncbi:MAG: hypothetical protein ABMA02_08580, partial [Saprospiraceae bacterium]